MNTVKRCQVSAPPPAKKTAGQIEKETLKKRISNDEGWNRCALSFLIKSTEFLPSTFDIQYSIFCGSLFGHAKSHMSHAAGLKRGQFNHQESVPFWRSFI
jgi:hypothetical protein